MINVEKVKYEFDEYVKQFNLDAGKIKLKIDHIKRVAKLSRMIAINLNLDEESIRLAETIGFFHDIGRFKQAEIYNTFSDNDSINHAELSAKVLFEDNLIEKFEIDEKYKDIIKIAVLNHNKNKIDIGLNKNEILFSKLIRDADKLDIYYTICNYDFESIFWYKEFDCPEISGIIMNQFINLHEINYKDIKCNADQITIFYAYIFDLYFNYSLDFLKSKNYLENFTEKVCKNFKSEKIHSQTKEILKYSNDFLNKYSIDSVIPKKIYI